MFLEFADLSPFPEAEGLTEATAAIMIRDVEGEALGEASCIIEPGFPYQDAVTAILRGAVLRWAGSGSAGIKTHQETAGPLTETRTWDNTHAATRSAGRLWPSEIKKLRGLCLRWRNEGTSSRRKAFTIMPGLRR